MLRLSLVLGRTPGELFEQLTASDIACYQALVEIDGPWWGEREAAHLRQIASMQAAAAGADVRPDEFAIHWEVGGGGAQPAAEDHPPGDGIALFAATHDLTVEEIPA